jgi:CubicO group peptidase (beta-lactamase class C family)
VCFSLALACEPPPQAETERPGPPEELSASGGSTARDGEHVKQLEELRTKLGIPGMSAALIRDGRIVWREGFGDAKARDIHPIASITKTMTGVLAAILVKEGTLDLDRPATSYARKLDLPRDVTVRHLLSHTSVGTLGKTFSYNGSRFAMLRPVLEAAGQTTLGDQFQTHIFGRAVLADTVVTDELDGAKGVRAPADDLAMYAARLLDGVLLPAEARAKLLTTHPTFEDVSIPYGLGFFVHELSSQTLAWHYGQLADASSLLVLCPETRSAFVLLAHSDRASAPFSLFFGNPLWSPFVVAALPWMGVEFDPHHKDVLMSKALLAGARDRAAMERRLLKILQAHPQIAETPDAGMLHVLARTEAKELRDAAEAIGKLVLRTRNSDPRAKLDLAVLRLKTGKRKRAVELLEEVIALKGHPLLVQAASFVLGEHLHATDPKKARPHLERVVSMGHDAALVRDAEALLAAPENDARGKKRK